MRGLPIYEILALSISQYRSFVIDEIKHFWRQVLRSRYLKSYSNLIELDDVAKVDDLHFYFRVKLD